MRTADDRLHGVRTHLTNVLLAFQLLRRWDARTRREARAVEAGLASARALRRLFRRPGGRPDGGAATRSARMGAD
jgi:hypothetical protein